LSSIDWYETNGEAFFANSAHVPDLPQRLQFQRFLPTGGTVLDAGCGSGRDALAFSRAGFDVTAFDASATMVRLAAGHTGLQVRRMGFAEVAWREAFDGVWACASLLHLSAAELPHAIACLRRALKPGGVFFASFKLGEGRRFANGRWFTDLDAPESRKLLSSAGLDVLATEITEDLRPDRQGELWLSALARRPTNDGA
jgi:SAM-dependent methyltransferase